MLASKNETLEAFRTLLLPVAVDNEETCISVLVAKLDELGVTSLDHPGWLRLRVNDWRDSGSADPRFRDVLSSVLVAGHDQFGDVLAMHYFELHSELQKLHFLSHDQATAFMSHSLLMARLAKDEHMSSAQIARLLSARDRRVSFSRQTVDMCVTKLGVKRDLDQVLVEQLFKRDSELEIETFADADLAVCADMVNALAAKLGFPGDLQAPLQVLANPTDLSAYTPYLQILHYQCILAEFFDHAVTDLYEFNPRGVTATWLFGQYPDALVSAGNPFLNNAKSVERVSAAWARSKKKNERPGAMALLATLEGLESMGFAARKELSGWVRLWLHRVIRFAQPISDVLPEKFTAGQIAAILSAVSLENTQTAGVIEQRVVDALAVTMHKLSDGWRARGLGDSVNATNISRRKLGDCDFQNAETRTVIAYEAHGGRLTPVYLDEHRRTLEKTLVLRCDEWSGFSEPSEWKLKVVFVAHEVGVEPPAPFQLNGVAVEIAVMTFADYIRSPADPGAVRETFLRYVREPLNERRTPNSVRKVLKRMAATA